MYFEEAKEKLLDLQQKRKSYIDHYLSKEENYWKRIYQNNGYFIEKKLIHEVLDECKRIPYLGDETETFSTLDNTSISGDKFLKKDQLIEVIKKAGLDVEIERIDDSQIYVSKKTSLKVKIDFKTIKESNFVIDELDMDDEKIETLIKEGKQDWLKEIIGGYINYLMTDKAHTITEKKAVDVFFDKLTDEWEQKHDQENKSNHLDYFVRNNPIVSMGDYIRIDMLNSKFGSMDNVLNKLRMLLASAGFEMMIDYNEHSKSSIMLSIKESNHMFDEKTGEIKSLFLK